MAFEELPDSYPSQFYFNVSRLAGAYSKSLVKVVADNQNSTPNGITTIRIPIGVLLNTESLNLYFDVATTGTNAVIPPRYSSTFISRMSVSINNVSTTIINDYNLVYNTLNDLTNKNYTKGIAGEFLDPTIIWGEGAGASTDVALTGASALLASTANGTYKMCINNFMGLLGSCSTKVWPTSKMGEILINIQWANADILCGTGEASSTTYNDNSYSISNIAMTMEAYSFSSDEYYNGIEGQNLRISYDDYIVTKFAPVQKKTGINVTTYLSANSLDWVCATAIQESTAPRKMVGYGSLGTGATESVVANRFTYLADPRGKIGNSSATSSENVEGDGFFNTKSMQRNLQHIANCTFSINNRQLNFGSLSPLEIFQNNLLALGYENNDKSANGFHEGCVSLYHFWKYYGICMQSLELIDKDTYYISGLSSAGSSCSVNVKIDFSGASNTLSVTPVVIAKVTKLLTVGAGRSITIE